eukprot:223025-Chlamydomonas_euryale.AAC.5
MPHMSLDGAARRGWAACAQWQNGRRTALMQAPTPLHRRHCMPPARHLACQKTPGTAPPRAAG